MPHAVSSSYPHLTLPLARARNPRIHGQTFGRGHGEILPAGPDGLCVRPSVAPSATIGCSTVLCGLVSDVGGGERVSRRKGRVYRVHLDDITISRRPEGVKRIDEHFQFRGKG